MKNIICILLLSISCPVVLSQIVTIPDAIFKNALVNESVVDTDGDEIGDVDADTNDDGEIQVSEALAVGTLVLHSYTIASLEGIEEFQNLSILICRFAILEGVDISQNIALEKVDFTANELLTELDVSLNINLTSLGVGGTSIENFDLTGLDDLRILYIDGSDIVDLNLTGCSSLEYFWAVHSILTDLNTDDCTNLIFLDFTDGNLVNIDVTNNQNIEFLYLAGNNIPTLDITLNPNLDTAYLGGSPIKTLDVSQNPLLRILAINATDITDIDVSDNPELKEFFGNSANLSSIVDLSQNPELTSVRVDGNPNIFGLNIQNGNNEILFSMYADATPNLTCIQVDDLAFAKTQPNWQIDANAEYSLDCEFLGLTDPKRSNSLFLYPNPSSDYVQLSMNKLIEEVRVYTLSGREINIPFTSESIDVRSLPVGVYFIQFKSDQVRKILKFVKN